MRGKQEKLYKEFLYVCQMIGEFADLYFLTDGKVRDGPEVFSKDYIEKNLILLLEKRHELDKELEKYE